MPLSCFPMFLLFLWFYLHLLSIIQFPVSGLRDYLYSVCGSWRRRSEGAEHRLSNYLPSPFSTHFLHTPFFSSVIFHPPLSNPSKSCALLGYWNDWWWRPAHFLLTSPSAWHKPEILTTNVILLLYLLKFFWDLLFFNLGADKQASNMVFSPWSCLT